MQLPHIKILKLTLRILLINISDKLETNFLTKKYNNMIGKNKQNYWIFPGIFVLLTLVIFLGTQFKVILELVMSGFIATIATVFIYLFWMAFMNDELK